MRHLLLQALWQRIFASHGRKERHAQQLVTARALHGVGLQARTYDINRVARHVWSKQRLQPRRGSIVRVSAATRRCKVGSGAGVRGDRGQLARRERPHGAVDQPQLVRAVGARQQRLAHRQRRHEAAERPHVHTRAVARAAARRRRRSHTFHEYLGRAVPPRNCVRAAVGGVVVLHHEARKPEVADLDDSALCDQHILRLRSART
eukprot:362430-Chlamydomonas_euryale.AAC.5